MSKKGLAKGKIYYLISRVKRKKLLIPVLLILFIMSIGQAVLTSTQANQEKALEKVTAMPEDIKAGKKIYEKRCIWCHGPEGRGDGAAAPFLDPTPRDFTEAQFKIRSTPHGEPPTDEDLLRVLEIGMGSTAMQAWNTLLSEKERGQVVQYIKTFSERFAKEGAPKKITIDKEIQPTDETVAQGKELYKKMKCFLCHGDEGRGDGPITVTLRNEWGRPFDARDLTKGWTFRGGNTLRDIYRTISTGLNGTPMGPYADYLTPEERWSLAHYVKSLSPEKEEEPAVAINSKMLKEDLPDDPNDPQWDSADSMEIRLSGQVIEEPRLFISSFDAIVVKSLYNEKEIAFLLEWNDRTNIQDEIFQDAVSIQFPVKIPEGTEKPYFLMGQRGWMVNIWQWKAGWQEDQQYVEKLDAEGSEKILPQPLKSQSLKGKGVWSNGRWKVVFKRSLSTEDKEKDIQFERGKFIPIAFNVWDGSNGEIGKRTAISAWFYVMLETPTSFSVYVYTLMGLFMGVAIEWGFVRKIRRPSNTDKPLEESNIIDRSKT